MHLVAEGARLWCVSMCARACVRVCEGVSMCVGTGAFVYVQISVQSMLH